MWLVLRVFLYSCKGDWIPGTGGSKLYWFCLLFHHEKRNPSIGLRGLASDPQQWRQHHFLSLETKVPRKAIWQLCFLVLCWEAFRVLPWEEANCHQHIVSIMSTTQWWKRIPLKKKSRLYRAFIIWTDLCTRLKNAWPRLFERWITLSTALYSFRNWFSMGRTEVVLYNVIIHRIIHCIPWKTWFVWSTLLCWFSFFATQELITLLSYSIFLSRFCLFPYFLSR